MPGTQASVGAPMRDRLDALVAVQRRAAVPAPARRKNKLVEPVGRWMTRLLARLELIEATGALDIDVGWAMGTTSVSHFHSVRTASADRVREMAAPRRHLALICFPCTKRGTTRSTRPSTWIRVDGDVCERPGCSGYLPASRSLLTSRENDRAKRGHARPTRLPRTQGPRGRRRPSYETACHDLGGRSLKLKADERSR